jgi:hypothetical protein
LIPAASPFWKFSSFILYPYFSPIMYIRMSISAQSQLSVPAPQWFVVQQPNCLLHLRAYSWIQSPQYDLQYLNIVHLILLLWVLLLDKTHRLIQFVSHCDCLIVIFNPFFLFRRFLTISSASFALFQKSGAKSFLLR